MDLVQLRSMSRRDALKHIASSATILGVAAFPLEAGQQVHQHIEEEKTLAGSYRPKLFNEHEYSTITCLAKVIIPSDEISGSAVDAGAPEFIDLLASQNQTLADIYTGGLAWLDDQALHRYKTTFVESTPSEQIALLQEIVQASEERRKHLPSSYQNSIYADFRGYGVHNEDDLNPGIVFFDWVRKMVVDAFYTSPIGIKDIGYQGNAVLSRYSVPEDVIQYVLQHSPFPR